METKTPLSKKDKFSNMNSKQLAKIIKMLTIEIDGGRGIPIPSSWSEKIKRQFIRFCYRNLKEVFIAKVEVVNSFDETDKKS
jgi:hypothetical protein